MLDRVLKKRAVLRCRTDCPMGTLSRAATGESVQEAGPMQTNILLLSPDIVDAVNHAESLTHAGYGVTMAISTENALRC
jgi:hypothetical protein